MDAPELSPRSSTPARSGITRRRLLANGGWLAAAASLPTESIFALALPPQDTPPAPTPVGPVMQTLSTYMAAAATHPLPSSVVEQTKDHILDTLAAMISGSQLPPGRAALEFGRTCGGPPTSSLAASTLRIGPFDAAMLNGILAHSDETDDSNSPSQSHPGCAVIPAALAAGEKFSINGLQFLRAVTLGYDIGCRMGIHVGPFVGSVPVEFAETAGGEAHVDAGEVFGGREFALSDLVSPSSVLETLMVQVEGVPDGADVAAVSAGRGVGAGIFAEERKVLLTGI